jgi:hypothetical protein
MRIIGGKDMVSWSTGRIEYTREFGRMMSVKEKAMRDIQTEISTKEISKMAKLTAKEYTIGPTEKYTTESGAEV